MNLSTLLLLLLTLIAQVSHGHLVHGPTYIAAQWRCGLEYECYVVVSWADGWPVTGYEIR